MHSVIRFTGGLGLAAIWRRMNSNVNAKVNVPPDVTCVGCSDQTRETGWSSATSKTVPALILDASLLLGSTPGTKFQLGAMAAFEFYGDSVSTDPQSADTANGVVVPRPGMQVARGTEVFIGPIIGLQFGE
jgi:hypothetical protein